MTSRRPVETTRCSKRSARWRPAIAARAEEIERRRRLPPDLVGDVTAAGCFRMPGARGATEAPSSDLPAHLQMIEQLSQRRRLGGLDGRPSAAPRRVLLAKLPRATFDALYAAGPDVVIAGDLQPDRRGHGR